MGKRMKVGRRALAALCVVSISATSINPVVYAAGSTGNLVGDIEVNPQVQYQTLEGWGTSLCWWGNVIGSAGDNDYNGNGRPDREEIAELAFSPEYLNLNIVRYNVGGGDKEDTSIKRVEGLVPGWSMDMYGNHKGEGDFLGDEFYNKSAEEMNDAGQIWMFEQANAYRQESGDIINKVFSNSPPYYMTKSGSSTGGNSWNEWEKSNLKDEYYDDFAQYLARAAKWLDKDLQEKYGTKIDYIEPLNEPDTNYWLNGSTKQEGCIFRPGAEQSKAYSEMQKALDEEGLTDIALTGTDETALGNAIYSFNQLDSSVKKDLKTISAHTYGGNDSQRNELRKIAASYDKGLWMSEITRGGGSHTANSHDSMDLTNTKSQSQGIMADLKYMQSSAWIAWLVADSEYECLQTNSNWGLLHYVFEENGPVEGYHTNLLNWDGTPKDGVPESGYWAVTKQFYTMMQYSKYLKAGYTMIDIGDGNMCAAISPDRDELVIVAQNFDGERTTSVDLNAFTNAASAQLYRTTDSESCELVDTLDVSKGILNVTLPSNSVSTYVVKAADDGALYEDQGYATIVESDIQTSEDTIAAGASDMNKFTYTGSWSGAKDTTDNSATATFKFEGNQGILYGTKSVHGAKLQVIVDDGEAVEIDTFSEQTKENAVLFDTGSLESGTHTIWVCMAAEQTVDSPMISIGYAKIVQGKISKESPRIESIASHQNALTVVFQGVEDCENYTICYGTDETQLDQEVTTDQTTCTLKNLENGIPYYVQVRCGEDIVSEIVEAVPQAPEEGVYYFVNAGTEHVFETATDEQFGVYNSNLDQVYGEDTITGKMWGYVDNSNIVSYGKNRWESVRVDEQNTAGKGLEYKFELEPGSYTVAVGMQDPWKNGGRSQDIRIQGEIKEKNIIPTNQTIRYYKAEVGEDKTLRVEVIRSSSNSGGNEDPLVSFLSVEALNDEQIVSIESSNNIAAVNGVVPTLPTKVTANTLGGEQVQKDVIWNVKADMFQGDMYSTVKVEGTVQDTELKAVEVVTLVPRNVQYFIDCNNLKSKTYSILDAAADLLNEVPDKAYEEGSYGYLDSYGVRNAGNDKADKYENGWYAKSGQSIQYTVPLLAGKYNTTFGFQEWWGNSSRQMSVTASYVVGDETKEIAIGETSTSWQWQTRTIVKEFTLEQDAEVTFTVSKTGSSDPVLSYFDVGKILEYTALTSAMNEAAAIDRSIYTADSLAILDTSVTNGRQQFSAASATQDTVDKAEAAIRKAIEELVKIEEIPGENDPEFTEEELSANDYVLYTTNCGTPNAEEVPSGYKLGLCQSNVDQEFAEDSQTKKQWGYAPADANSELKQGGKNATDITESYRYMSENVVFDKEKSGLRYDFEVPASTNHEYKVVVGFKNPWNTRTVDIQLEGDTVEEDISIVQGEVVEKEYVATVEDGQLNVNVHSPKRTNQYGDPLVNYIIVKAVPSYKIAMLAESISEIEEAMKGKTYSETTLANYTKAKEAAQRLIDAQSEDTEAIKTAYWALQEAFKGLKEITIYDSISGVAGAPRYDNNGVQIQAHGGQIQKMTVNGVTKYYWIGEDKTWDYRPVGGIHLYTSTDLYNWKDEGVVLKTMESMEEFETDPYFKKLYGDYSQEKKEQIFIDLDKNKCVIERPKMIYNEKTGKYVIWFHADGRTPQYPDADYGKANAGVAIADSPTGPFKLLGSWDLNYNADADQGYDTDHFGAVRDMNLFVDDDKTAYVIYSSEGNQTTIISQLNEDYTGLVVPREEAVEGVHFTRNFVGWSREAPAMFKYKEKYYIINSGCTGWAPNQAKYAMADSPMGPWTDMGDPCSGENSGTTFSTQSTCVVPVDAANGKFMYMGDRWEPGDLSESRYVWLPIEFQTGGKMVIRPYTDWTLDVLEGKGLFDIVTELPKESTSIEALAAQLPEKVDVNMGETIQKDVAVTWDIDTSKTLIGPVTVTGTLEKYGRTFEITVDIYEPSMLYFFDCAAKTSEYFVKAKEKIAGLRNESVDQRYTEENHAGYTNVETDLGIMHKGETMYEHGWWAKQDKNIDYAFDLKEGEYTAILGFQEWWNIAREMDIVVTAKNTSGEEVNLASMKYRLESWTSRDIQNLKFTVPEDVAGKVTVSIRKAGSADVVLSFISILGKEKPSVDKTKLQEVIEIAKALQEDEYTAESYANVISKLAEAELVNEKADATQEAVNAATKALNDAIKNLVKKPVVDKAELAKAIKDAKALQADDYTEESYANVVSKLAEAELVNKKADATQEAVDAATKALNDAIKNLVKKPVVDKAELAKAINAAKALQAGDYTAASYAKVVSRLAEAEAVNEKADATQEEVVQAIENLINAQKGLITLESVLKKGIEDNKVTDPKDKYTQESWNVYSKALKAAEALLKSETYTEDKVNSVVNDLTTAKKNLKLKDVLKPGWHTDSNGKFYIDESGKPVVNTWKNISKVWYYFNPNGYMEKGWKKIQGVWYYLGTDGKMRTEWQKLDGTWYFLGNNGKMRTGWQNVEGAWYFLGSNGKMKTGWQKVDGAWYFLGSNGKMKTEWQKVDGTWYLLGSNGKMKTGWQNVKGTWYYMNSNGIMAKDTWIGKYYVNSSGEWVKSIS